MRKLVGGKETLINPITGNVIAQWIGIRLYVHLNQDSVDPEWVLDMAEWIKETRPKQYIITKRFDEKPIGVWLRTEYHNPDGAFSVNENEIEEVWE